MVIAAKPQCPTTREEVFEELKQFYVRHGKGAAGMQISLKMERHLRGWTRNEWGSPKLHNMMLKGKRLKHLFGIRVTWGHTKFMLWR